MPGVPALREKGSHEREGDRTMNMERWMALGIWIETFRDAIKCGEIKVSVEEPYVVRWFLKGSPSFGGTRMLSDRMLTDSTPEMIRFDAASVAETFRRRAIGQ